MSSPARKKAEEQALERIRNQKFNNESIAEGEVSIKKEKIKVKKKKRFIFF